MPSDRGWASENLRERSYLRIKNGDQHGLIIIHWAKGTSKNFNGYNDIIGIEKAIVIRPFYDSVIVDVYPEIWSKQKVGIFFSENEIVVPQFDSIKRVSEIEDKFYVWKSEKCGMIDRTGRILNTAYNVADIRYYNGNENNEIHILTEGEPYTMYDLKTRKFTTFTKDRKPILNNDSIEMVFGYCFSLYGKYTTIRFVNKSYEQTLHPYLYERIVYANEDSGVIIKDYDSPDFKYFTYYSFRYLFKVKLGDSQKLEITMIEPISERIICEFNSYVFDKKSLITLGEHKGFYRLEILDKKGNYEILGFINPKDDSFSKKEPK